MSDSVDGHAPLVGGYVTGEREAGWVTRNSGHAHRDLVGGGRLEVQPGLDRASTSCFQWRHLAGADDTPPTPWVGAAPTAGQAQLDADQHAHRCSW